MPAGKALAGAEIELVGLPRREYRLRDSLQALAERYDFILIDCPPSLGLLTLNGLCAADSFIVPVQCEYYALEGLSDLIHTVRAVKQGGLNAELEMEGVLLTMFDARLNLSLQVAEEVKRHFPGKVFKTVIPRNVRLSEAPSHGKPVQVYDPSSRGADSYDALAEEIIKRSKSNNN
jgi:chromosome partitioning protein